MTNIILFLNFLVFSSLAGAETPCLETLGTCQFYSCIAAKHDCSKQDYPQKFALPYCESFYQNQETYSPFGQSFMEQTRLCLQVSLAVRADELTCASMRKAALQDHYRCYLANGFCELPAKDKVQILRAIAQEFRHSDFLLTATRIEKSCFLKRPN